MATLKEVKTKISSIRQTKKITKAMNMVAASKLRGAQFGMEAFRPYAGKFAEVLGSLSERAGEATSPLLTPRENPRKIHILLFTSDRGLCGGFNTNLLEKAQKFIAQWNFAESGDGDNADQGVSITAFGKKGRSWCRKKALAIKREQIGVVGARFGFNVAATEARHLLDGFMAGDFDEAYMIYAEFVSVARQIPAVRKLLPIPPIEKMEEQTKAYGLYLPEHICEPSPEELLGEMLPKSVEIQIHRALLETSACEHAARMTAMDNATKACNDMMGELTLLYNKARQAAITADLMDIVGGAEALKG